MFKKLLPIAATLVLVVTLLVPTTVLAARWDSFSVSLTDNTPGETNVDYTIEFTTATELPACSGGGDYSWFDIKIYGHPGLPADGSGVYTFSVDGSPQSWESGGGAPTSDGAYTVSVDDVDDMVNIKFCHTAALGDGTVITVDIIDVTNGLSGTWHANAVSYDVNGDPVDNGGGPYTLRNPEDIACVVRVAEVSIEVTDGAVDYGAMDLDSVRNTAQYDVSNNENGMGTPETQTITNNSGPLAIDLQIASLNAVDNGPQETDPWMLVGSSPGEDEFTHAFQLFTTAYDGLSLIGSFTSMETAGSYYTLATGVEAGGERFLELEIGTPSSLSGAYAPHMVVVTIMASAATP